MPKQNLLKSTNSKQVQHFINVKTKIIRQNQHLVTKVTPNAITVSLKPKRELTSTEQKILDWEVQEYFSEKNSGVRRYNRDKTFTWHEDLWPHFRQLIEIDYQGPSVSAEEHRE